MMLMNHVLQPRALGCSTPRLSKQPVLGTTKFRLYSSQFKGDPPPDRIVADTSDEEGNLPSDPLDLDEEMMIPQKPTIRELYKNTKHPNPTPHTETEKPIPGSHEEPNAVPPPSVSELPPSADRAQHERDRALNMQEEAEKHVYHPIDEPQQHRIDPEFNLNNGDTPLEFQFNVDLSSSDEEEDADGQRAANKVLEALKEQSTESNGSIQKLNGRISALTNVYNAHHYDTQQALKKRIRQITAVRVAEVTAGRAAAIGLLSAVLTETVYRQSVLSQLMGRFEGQRQVEAAVPQATTLALAVLAGALALTAMETVLKQQAPPSIKWLGLSHKAQLWGGRMAMLGFAALCVFEAVHSNRPLFPFYWFF